MDDEFIPFCIALLKDDERALQDYFEGPIPKAGDSVELYCYYVDETCIKMKWRVNNG